jgi:transcriptional regulator with XRE-family HTH domain
MNYTQNMLDEYKNALRLRSDSAMADALGVTRATVSRWRKGNGHPEPALAWEIAVACGRNPAEVMVSIEAERARTLRDAQAWQRVRNLYIMSNLSAHMRRKKLLLSVRPTSASAVNHLGNLQISG